jgi:hypothetical protein
MIKGNFIILVLKMIKRIRLITPHGGLGIVTAVVKRVGVDA